VGLCLIVAGCAKNTSPPTISGSTVDGATLTANPGSWTGKGSISFAYQWQRCDTSGNACQNVGGATGTTYGLGPADVGSTMRVVVTGTDADGPNGASSATSGPTGVVTAKPPANTTPPSVSGTAKAGQTLSATNGSWSGTPPLSFGYQWQRCNTSGNSCQNVSGANSSNYLLGSSDVSSTIRVSVTATNAGGSSSASSAATAVVAAAHDPVVVAVGDIACAPGDTSNDCQQGMTANLASAQNPDAALTLGDNQYNSGLLSEYNGAGAYNATWGVFNPIVRPDPGNHEYTASSTAAGYFSYFGAATSGSTASAPYYSYNLGSWHLISLDSSCSASGCGDLTTGQTTSAQTSWLQNDLATHPAACTLAYWHHPRFSTSWTNDSPGTGPLFSALYNAHADLALSGHDHVYERYAQVDPSNNATTSGVREIVAGTGGENLFSFLTTESTLQVKDNTHFGVLVLTLHAASYDWAFKGLDGSVLDTGTTACHGTGTGSVAARAARNGRVWPVGPTGPKLAFDARPQPATLATVARHGLSVAIHATRAPNVAITVSLRRGRHLTRIASFYETETEIPRPHSRIALRLPARWLKGRGSARLEVRFAATAAGQRRTVTRTVVLRRH
jgi:hypothetical protein